LGFLIYVYKLFSDTDAERGFMKVVEIVRQASWTLFLSLKSESHPKILLHIVILFNDPKVRVNSYIGCGVPEIWRAR
jgi:hypothetical protein